MNNSYPLDYTLPLKEMGMTSILSAVDYIFTWNDVCEECLSFLKLLNFIPLDLNCFHVQSLM